MTSRPHPTTTTALPVDTPHYKCRCERSVVQRVCIGCCVFFCIECYEDHRRKESEKFSYKINENDLLIKAIYPLQSVGTNVRHFDPLALNKSIYDALDRCHARENGAVANGLKTLRKLLDKRHDELMELITPITTDLQSSKDAQNYINAHFDRFKDELRQKNNELEKKDNAKFVSVIDKIETIDWKHLIDIKTVAHHGPMTLDYSCLSRKPFLRIDQQSHGRALAASDHLVIYARQNELVIIEPDADYSIIIPMRKTGKTVPTIVDICWSSLIGVFIILTQKCVFELSPHLKKLKHLENIQAPDETNFRSCTCFDQTLLVSYEGNCLLDEWKGSGDQEWKHVKQWNWAPVEERSPREIHCVRYSRKGSTLGCVFSNNRRSELFEIRDSNTMDCVGRAIIPARPCCGFVWMPDDHWLIAIQDWHIIFRVTDDGRFVDEVTIAELGRVTIHNIALVALGTVVIRSQHTLVFFDLLES